MSLDAGISLLECATGDESSGEIVRLDRETAKELSTGWIECNWWSNLPDLISSPEDQPDYHWDWVALVSRTQNAPSWSAVCVRSSDDRIQGAMLYRVGVRSARDAGERAIFIDRLATAPRNRPDLVKSPEYRGVGEGLLCHAIAESWMFGLKGRVSLFPVAHEEFYRERGFRPTSTQSSDGFDTLYEIAPDDAVHFLRTRGMLP